ncbi:MAG: glycosyltransferase family 10 [Methylacidiphilales bacterium]|nr:glycosyltransferase family 10 [Candidatus Methylacidiphilales bacterium]
MNEIKVFLKPGTPCPLQIAGLPSRYGLTMVGTPGEADWIVVPRIKTALPFLARYPWKRFLVYTNEPRLSNSCDRQKHLVPLLPPVEIMGVFTGDVFWHHFHFLGSCHFEIDGDFDIDIHHSLPMLTSKETAPDAKPVAAFISYRLQTNTSWIVGGIERDLEVPRCSYAQALHQAGLCDIYGSGWPQGVSEESSGYTSELGASEPWWTRKLKSLAQYRYNICLENTAADFYCTEKIWHAIQAGTLPIYWGANSRINDLFPKNSFIDLAQFESPAHLIDFIQALPEKDYLDRSNQCREVFNRCIAQRRDTVANDPALHMERIMARLRSHNSSPSS